MRSPPPPPSDDVRFIVTADDAHFRTLTVSAVNVCLVSIFPVKNRGRFPRRTKTGHRVPCENRSTRKPFPLEKTDDVQIERPTKTRHVLPILRRIRVDKTIACRPTFRPKRNAPEKKTLVIRCFVRDRRLCRHREQRRFHRAHVFPYSENPSHNINLVIIFLSPRIDPTALVWPRISSTVLFHNEFPDRDVCKTLYAS